MRISNIKVLPVDGDKVLKAFVTIEIEGSLVIRDLKVINGKNGLFVAMPAKRMKDGTYWDLVHPIDSRAREKLEESVLSEYKKVCAEAPVEEPGEDEESA